MADTFKIYNAAGTLIIDLRATATFLMLDTWNTTLNGDGTVTETFLLGLTGTDATLRSNIELLHRIKKAVEDYFDDTINGNSQWLRAYSDGENAKQALIYMFDAEPVSEDTHTPLLGRGHTVYQIAIVRAEAWEDTGGSISDWKTVSCKGGFDEIVKPGASFDAGMDGRIYRTIIKTGPSGASLYRVWLGIQPLYGSLTTTDISDHFDPIWEAEKGTAVSGTFVNDATANPSGTSSNCLDVTTVPSSLTRVFVTDVLDHADSINDVEEFRGEWYVLARLKVDTGTVGVQLRPGVYSSLTSGYTENTNEIVYVSNTSWRLIDLGKCRIPIYGWHSGYASGISNNTLSLFIQQISGTTTHFKLDYLVLIPAKHFLKGYKTFINDTSGTIFYVREDGKTDCLFELEDGRPEATFINWKMPSGGGFFVVAAERETSHDLTDTITVQLDTVYRYRGHRG